MPLQGTFDVLDFSEVLRLLARQQLTGRLHVRSRSFAANLFLEEGALVGADQSEHQAAAATGDVRGRLEEICFEMLDAERGGFEFQPGRPSSLPSTTKLRVDTVLSRARKRLQEWQELQELIPSLDLQPRLVEDLSASEVTIDQERWRMLTVVDGRRSLRAIGRTLNLSDFDVCRVVKSLLEEGVVELDPRAIAMASAAREAVAPPVATVDTPSVHEVVRVADRGTGNGSTGRGGQATNGHTGTASVKVAGDPAADTADAGGALGSGSGAAADVAAGDQGDDSGAGDWVAEPSPEGAPGATDPVIGEEGAGEQGAGEPGADAISGVSPEAAGVAAPAPAAASSAVAVEAAAAADGAGTADDEGGRGRRRRVVRIRSRSPRETEG